ncbi:tRNA (adenosine(37)-N6)-threonylcarbamoyltransferase complex ATPase subunit type 1 TsaE [Pedobacter sp. SD-b]|uniref:tRNA threonylcarbamoyladenosine biosynthesis protein TsaE n=1 Tax=Pedobacter segetis TaxID=2793069 RepID=A0ABS1BGK7_9SPHI|nr:tRNA (adenosine(37)-N6)-threonylcarbamoyltransferase complex ATPase subunit type 1 TsaE [Pedobacter segetis]MBK0381998.1 tRNA (adenosine(37)-N6)-threonylcarbamoyltransferase complex ATPase subunit type 1 TsaE [Pedobacter segetis]
MKIKVASLIGLEDVAKTILNQANKEKIFLFFGSMGAGKTTLINKLCELLGTKDHTSSPTFSIVNEYELENGSIFHFDFYRLKNQNEGFDMGYEDYFYSGNYCFVEWPEKIADLLPEHYTKVQIEILGETEREIELSVI